MEYWCICCAYPGGLEWGGWCAFLPAVGHFPSVGTGGGADLGSVPQWSMKARAGIVMSLVQRVVAESTWRSYERVWREWLELMSDIGGCASSDDRPIRCFNFWEEL